MKTAEYWKKRFEQLEDAQNQMGAAAAADIQKAYDRATREISEKILLWYQRFADNNGITLAEARQWLKGKDLEELKWDVQEYIRHGEENAIDQQWMKELENASAKYHISKYEALEIELRESIEELAGKYQMTMEEAMGEIYQSGYYHTAFEIQKGIGIGYDIASVDQNAVEKVLSKPWAADGLNFSERIWNNKQKLIDVAHKELTQGIMLGKDPQKAIDAISKQMNVSKVQAGRLVMTEEAYFASESRKDCFNELGVEQYVIVATLDNRTSEICQEMDGKVFKMSEYQAGTTAPPFHVNCVLPDTVVYAPDATALIKSEYSGDVIEITTANGSNVTVTPNHIMLTSRGWVRAKNIIKGDKVIHYNGWEKFVMKTNPTDNHCVPTIEDLFTALSKDLLVPSTTVPATAKDLKGDVIKNSKINIIFVNSLLRDKMDFASQKLLSDSTLIRTGNSGRRKAVFPTNCTVASLLVGIGLASDGIMRGSDIASMLLGGSACHHELVGFRRSTHYDMRLLETMGNDSRCNIEPSGEFIDTEPGLIQGNNFSDRESFSSVGISNCNTLTCKNSCDWFSTNAKGICDFCNAFAGVIELNNVIDVKVKFYTGHVYDTSSMSTLYISNGILTSNCRTTTAPHFEDMQDIVERAARDDTTGKVYDVPGNMTYNEWKKEFVDNDKVTKNDGKTIITSGGVAGARNPYGKKASEHAKRYYEAVRKMTTDVARIAETTGRSVGEIQAIKDFIFIDEHDLSDGRHRFDPDYMMAESWRRLIDGKPEPHDLTMINHEIMERELMALGIAQDEAHKATATVFNYSAEAEAYYAKIKKFKKE